MKFGDLKMCVATETEGVERHTFSCVACDLLAILRERNVDRPEQLAEVDRLREELREAVSRSQREPAAKREQPKWSEERIEAWAQSCREALRTQFQEDGKILRPKALLLATRDPRTKEPLPEPAGIMLMPESFELEGPDRDRFATTIRLFSRQSAALAYVFVSEVWSISGDKDSRRKIRGSFEHVPGRREGLLCVYHRLNRAKPVAWFAVITRDSKGRPSVGPFEVFGGEIGGRFAEDMIPVGS